MQQTNFFKQVDTNTKYTLYLPKFHMYKCFSLILSKYFSNLFLMYLYEHNQLLYIILIKNINKKFTLNLTDNENSEYNFVSMPYISDLIGAGKFNNKNMILTTMTIHI